VIEGALLVVRAGKTSAGRVSAAAAALAPAKLLGTVLLED